MPDMPYACLCSSPRKVQELRIQLPGVACNAEYTPAASVLCHSLQELRMPLPGCTDCVKLTPVGTLLPHTKCRSCACRCQAMPRWCTAKRLASGGCCARGNT